MKPQRLAFKCPSCRLAKNLLQKGRSFRRFQSHAPFRKLPPGSLIAKAATGGVIFGLVISGLDHKSRSEARKKPQIISLTEDKLEHRIPSVVGDRIGGEWRLVHSKSESLKPFLSVLGVPALVSSFLDRLDTTVRLQILTKEAGHENGSIDVSNLMIRAENQTWYFGKDTKILTLNGEELEMTAKGGRKKYMASATIEFEDDGVTARAVEIRCRLHQRGDGWVTRQRFSLEECDAFIGPKSQLRNNLLKEEMIISSPNNANDVKITRLFRQINIQSDEVNIGRNESKAIDRRTARATVVGATAVAASIWCLREHLSKGGSGSNSK